MAELRPRGRGPTALHLWQATLVVIVAVVIVGTLPVCARLGVRSRSAGWIAEKQRVLSAPRFR